MVELVPGNHRKGRDHLKIKPTRRTDGEGPSVSDIVWLLDAASPSIGSCQFQLSFTLCSGKILNNRVIPRGIGCRSSLEESFLGTEGPLPPELLWVSMPEPSRDQGIRSRAKSMQCGELILSQTVRVFKCLPCGPRQEGSPGQSWAPSCKGAHAGAHSHSNPGTPDCPVPSLGLCFPTGNIKA